MWDAISTLISAFAQRRSTTPNLCCSRRSSGYSSTRYVNMRGNRPAGYAHKTVTQGRYIHSCSYYVRRLGPSGANQCLAKLGPISGRRAHVFTCPLTTPERKDNNFSVRRLRPCLPRTNGVGVGDVAFLFVFAKTRMKGRIPLYLLCTNPPTYYILQLQHVSPKIFLEEWRQKAAFGMPIYI